MNKRICGIYKISSKVHPEKIYIGSSVDIKDRQRTHLKRLLFNQKQGHSLGASPKLQSHFNKYGEEDLVFTVIEQFDFTTKEYLLSREQFYIDSMNPWFNVCKVAGSTLGVGCSDETKEKLRVINTGKKQSKETIEKRKSHGMSEETRQKHRDNCIFKDPTFIERQRERRKGKPHPHKNTRKKGEWHPSEESRKKMSDAKKGKTWEEWYGEENARKLKDARTKRKIERKKLKLKDQCVLFP